MEIRLENLTWPEVAEIVSQPHAVIVPTGSVEQHGRHLPLSVDYRCPEYVAELAAQKVASARVLVAPPIHYGEVSTTIKGFPGCIGVYTDAAIAMFADIARTFIKSGFQNIFFLNGHNTNLASLTVALRKVQEEYPDTGLYVVRWMAMGAKVISEIRKSEWGLHAEEMETSASLFIQPENVQMERAVKEFPEFSISDRWTKPNPWGLVVFHSRQRYPDRAKGDSGVMGDPTVASRETGRKILEAAADNLADLIVDVLKNSRGIYDLS